VFYPSPKSGEGLEVLKGVAKEGGAYEEKKERPVDVVKEK
jgi:hypothetical protein